MTVAIESDSAGKYRVIGALTFATARAALALGHAQFSKESQLEIDLSAVTAADSAGLALLIEWYRMASRANKKICFYAVPAQLRALAKIGDVDNLLPFEPSPTLLSEAHSPS